MMDSGEVSTTASFDRPNNEKVTNLKILSKNLQSIQTDEREEELLAELDTLEWDIVFMNETWRSKTQERWKTKEGHIFCGSGGSHGSKGVAVLLHSKWSRGFKAFQASSDLLCWVDCTISTSPCRLISVYFPHGGHDDEEVEGLYSEINKAVDGARRQNRTCIIMGDWNAVLGGRQQGDEEESVGLHGLGCRNDRGNCLAQWAGSQRLTIANTFFEKTNGEQWTHVNGNSKRQIYYGLICTNKAHWLTDAGANDSIGVGKDHRTVYMILALPQCNTRSQKKNHKSTNLKGWKAKDKAMYRKEVDSKISLIPMDAGIVDKCAQIERVLVETGQKWRSNNKASDDKMDEAKKQLRDFIHKRRHARTERNPQEVKRLSKLIQKEIKAVAKAAKTSKVCQVLEEFKDLGKIADTKRKGKKECISSMIDKEGKEVSDTKDIAEVFADFYEALYKEDNEKAYDYKIKGAVNEVSRVTPKEVRAQLKKMEKNKAADDAGIVCELLCEASSIVIEAIADLFTAILQPGAALPSSWKSSSIKVLFKKGDPKVPGNYRPVCIIPILYKMFSKVICERIKGELLKAQSEDQAGFRPGFSCEDHLFTITILAEKSNEFNIPLWVAAIDFSKAFDSISHCSIFRALHEQGVPTAYLDVMARLYEEQHAHVRGETQSRDFSITKGTKQGDLVSPFIFNAVLEEVMRKVKDKWRIRRYGLELEPKLEERLTNLRFADDILLIARTLPQIKQMLTDMEEECKKVGLNLHPEKTKILHNNIGYGRHVTKTTAGGMEIEVLGSSASTMYLGRLLSLIEPHDVELQHRLNKAWAKFGVYKEELTDKGIPVKLRLKLFHTVVSPTVLYGCSSWVLTARRDQRLKTTQMRMIRCIIGRKRKVESETGQAETWVSWIKRTSNEAKEMMRISKIPLWSQIVTARKQKWQARIESQSLTKWTSQALSWRPIGFRSPGHPRQRWDEEDQNKEA